jgi:hypothetical protein
VPPPTVGQRHRRQDRVVAVDQIARVQEEPRRRGADRVEDPQPSELGVAAPALAAGVARPREPPRGAGRRRRDEAAHRGRAAIAAVLEHHAVDDRLTGGQAGQRDGAREVTDGVDRRALDAARVREARGGVPLDAHPRGPIALGPHHGGVAVDVAGLDPARHEDPRHLDLRGAAAGGERGGGRGPAQQVAATGVWHRPRE